MKKRLVIVDISNFIFRAFYAIRLLHAPDGTPVNAVSGILGMLLKLLSQYRPTHLVLARDSRGKNLRNEIYQEYKANREEAPEDLQKQFPLIEELISKMKLPQIKIEGYEADDVIGSVVKQWEKDFDELFILSGDKDLMQFVNSKVKMLDTMKDLTYGEKEVFEKMGVYPHQIVDYLSMVGDSSDNVPGMAGIGAKGAAKLLNEYGSFENIVANKEKLTNKKLVTAFSEHLDAGLLSKKLIQIVTDLPLGIDADAAAFRFYPDSDLIDFLQRLGFRSAVSRLQEMARQTDQNGPTALEDKGFIINEEEIIDEALFFQKLQECQRIGLDLIFSSDDIHTRLLQKLCITFNENKTYWTARLELANKILDTVWADREKEVAAEDIKNILLYRFPLQMCAKWIDLSQIHYLIDHVGRHSLPDVAQGILGISLKDNLCAERSMASFLLIGPLQEKIKKVSMDRIYEMIDAPLIPVLAKMERYGVFINQKFFESLEQEFEAHLFQIEEKVAAVSGERINLKSPKQVGELLFEKLKLPVIKKTKTGASTDSEVLEELMAEGESEVPELILSYREVEKLLSTYVKALPALINPQSGRIHTRFTQNVTATGRLSSVHPNLQNIPVRSELGKRIRQGFIATPGKLLLAADYSQVELRLLAHFSKDSTMLRAFKNNEDIHAQTAAELLGVPLDEIQSSDRAQAKAVNFGLMYGQSSFGLARALKISRTDARDYIEKYFNRFSAVKSYLDSLKEFCEQHGFSETLHGRKRFIPDIHSQNRNIKSLAERLAINSPIQGTAADIIKLAMISIDREMEDRRLQSKMIIQVHDELIFEVPEEEFEIMKGIVKEKMEHVVELSVPLNVEMGVGISWMDLK